ncbi:hypothetical protein EVAR_79037_1 [Eumeta japonica]|uniref:Uncharacterized protein n=1 Tax=Eumeta variegata TaxID=151549 RepID=A0A4C1XUL3_EUMVA|nr:hypothetical protein EVAR_79037_1 [Eumeta japonica]
MQALINKCSAQGRRRERRMAKQTQEFPLQEHGSAVLHVAAQLPLRVTRPARAAPPAPLLTQPVARGRDREACA